MAVETGEAGTPGRALATVQGLKPGAGQAHLPGIAGQAEARQPGALVRGADGDHTGHPAVGHSGVGLGGQPGARRQPAHAVAHQQRRAAGAALQVGHCRFDGRHPGVDAAEHRRQRQRGAGHAGRRQGAQPGRPQAAVADKAMQQQHTGPAGLARHVRHAVLGKGLAPAEDQPAGAHLAGPGLEQLAGAGPGHRRIAAPGRQQHKFQGQHRRMRRQHQQQPGQPQASGHAVLPGPGRPAQRGQQGGQHQTLLQAGQHRGSLALAPATAGPPLRAVCLGAGPSAAAGCRYAGRLTRPNPPPPALS